MNMMFPTSAPVIEAAVRITAAGEIDRRYENVGRPAIFADKWGIVEGLRLINEAVEYRPTAERAPVSRNLVLQLVERGFVETAKRKMTEGRGRAAIVYMLTRKGKTYLAMSKSWKN